MNTSAGRHALAPNEFASLVNVIPIADGNLRVVPAMKALVSVSGQTINSMDSATVNGIPYIVFATSTGGLYALRTDTQALTNIASTLSTSGITFASWQGSNLLVLDPVGGLYHWNGTVFANVTSSVTGTAIAVYAGRVWVASARTVQYSAPNSFADWTVADGAGNFIITDEYLEGNIVSLVSSIDTLWIVGNGSVNALSNVAIQTGNITTFTVTNISNVSGTSFYTATMPYERSLMLANAHGVELYYGLVPQKISQPMDGFFAGVDYTKNISVALGTLYNQQVLLILCYSLSASKWLIACFTQGKWFLVDYGALSLLTWISQNGSAQAYATDGVNVYALFVDTATAVTGSIQTGFADGSDPSTFKQILKASVGVTAELPGGSISWTLDTENGSSAVFYDAYSVGYNWLRRDLTGKVGQYFGITVNFTLASANFSEFMVQFSYLTQWPGRSTIGY